MNWKIYSSACVKYPIVNFRLRYYLVSCENASRCPLPLSYLTYRNKDASLSTHATRRASVRVHVHERWIGAGERLETTEREEAEREREDARFSSRTSFEHRARRIYKWVITVWKGNKGGWHTAVDIKSRGQGNSNKYILTWESLADGLMHNNCNGHLSCARMPRHGRHNVRTRARRRRS